MIAPIIAWIGAHSVWGIIATLLGGGGIGAILGKIGLGRVRQSIGDNHAWLLLLAVAIAAAALYAWGATGRADRAQLLGWGRVVCASAGSELEPAKGKRGVACAAAVKDLATFKASTTEQTAKTLGDQFGELQRKGSANAAATRRDADRAQAALTEMEKANAAIGPDDRVGPDWLRALNDAAGLH